MTAPLRTTSPNLSLRIGLAVEAHQPQEHKHHILTSDQLGHFNHQALGKFFEHSQQLNRTLVDELTLREIVDSYQVWLDQ